MVKAVSVFVIKAARGFPHFVIVLFSGLGFSAWGQVLNTEPCNQWAIGYDYTYHVNGPVARIITLDSNPPYGQYTIARPTWTNSVGPAVPLSPSLSNVQLNRHRIDVAHQTRRSANGQTKYADLIGTFVDATAYSGLEQTYPQTGFAAYRGIDTQATTGPAVQVQCIGSGTWWAGLVVDTRNFDNVPVLGGGYNSSLSYNWESPQWPNSPYSSESSVWPFFAGKTLRISSNLIWKTNSAAPLSNGWPSSIAEVNYVLYFRDRTSPPAAPMKLAYVINVLRNSAQVLPGSSSPTYDSSMECARVNGNGDGCVGYDPLVQAAFISTSIRAAPANLFTSYGGENARIVSTASTPFGFRAPFAVKITPANFQSALFALSRAGFGGSTNPSDYSLVSAHVQLEATPLRPVESAPDPVPGAFAHIGVAVDTFEVYAEPGTAVSPTVQIAQSVGETLSGNPYTITWNSVNATSCLMTKTLNGVVQFGPSNPWDTALAGSKTVTPAAPGQHVFTAQCTGPGGTSSPASFLHTVTCPAGTIAVGSGASTSCAPVSTASINGTSQSAPPGTTFTVSWGSTNATSCVVTKKLNGVWQFPADSPWATGTSGSKTAGPSVLGLHEYINNCTGAGGASNTATFAHWVMQ